MAFNAFCSIGNQKNVTGNLSLPITLLNSYSVTFTVSNVTNSNYGQYIACSSTGQYVTFVCDKKIFYSSNYGSSFASISPANNMYCVTMSGNGKYQYACSTGVPACAIYMSSDYGVTWKIVRSHNTNNEGRWIQAVCCDVTGQYVFTTDGGSAGSNNNYYSKNYGVTWSSPLGSSIGTRTGCTINNTTFKAFSVAGQRQGSKALYSYLLTTTPSEITVNTLSSAGQWITSNGGNSIFFTTISNSSDGGFYYTATDLIINLGYYSSNGGTTWGSALNLPDFFISVWYNSAGTRLWAASSSKIYVSINNGSTWKTYSTRLSNMVGFNISSDSSKLFIVTLTGSIYSSDIGSLVI